MKSFLLKFSFVILLVGLLTLPSFSIIMIYAPRSVLPNTSSPSRCCAFNPDDFQLVSIREEDSHNIIGWWFPAPTEVKKEFGSFDPTNLKSIQWKEENSEATVIVVHGHGVSMARSARGDVTVIEKAVLPFHLAGFNVLAIDLRNHGLSGYAPPVSLGLFESEDLIRARKWLIHNQPDSCAKGKRIAVWGESMGAATAIFAASKLAKKEKEQFKALILDSSYASYEEASRQWIKAKIPIWIPEEIIEYFLQVTKKISPFDVARLKPDKRLETLSLPIMLSHGQSDPVIPFSHLETLAEAARLNNNPDDVLVHSHPWGHVRSWKDPDYPKMMVDFLEKYL